MTNLKEQQSVVREFELTDEYRHKALEMALTDFEKFCQYAGVNNKQLFVCIERSKGLSLGQIANRLKISRQYVKKICDRCEI